MRATPLLVTFSGLDGSGKSTQIANLLEHIESLGMKPLRLAFWDDVVVGKSYRETFVHKVYGSQPGIGAPGRPVERKDKNVRRWYLSIARLFLYMLDAIHLCEVLGRAKRTDADVIVMDRYIYDQLANLSLQNRLVRCVVEAIQSLAPRPDIAYLLDADVEAARARKPEYPLEFMRESRRMYFELASLLGTIHVVPPLSPEDAKRAVIAIFDARTSPPLRAPALDTAAA